VSSRNLQAYRNSNDKRTWKQKKKKEEYEPPPPLEESPSEGSPAYLPLDLLSSSFPVHQTSAANQSSHPTPTHRRSHHDDASCAGVQIPSYYPISRRPCDVYCGNHLCLSPFLLLSRARLRATDHVASSQTAPFSHAVVWIQSRSRLDDLYRR
jgi:hypothetical protein